MRRAALAALAAAGCTASNDPYPVDGAAELAPLGAAGAGIAGPIEILGSGTPEPNPFRRLAAYHVELPDGAAPWIRLYTVTSCEVELDPATLFEDLGLIRHVDDETHFFARSVAIGGRTLDVDIQTVETRANTYQPLYGYLPDIIAVAHAPGSGGSIMTQMGQTVPAAGPPLACGRFELR